MPITASDMPSNELKDRDDAADTMLSALSLHHSPQGEDNLNSFHRFSELPAELRELVYEYYFAGTVIAPKGQPRTTCGTAIVFASHQLFEEATAVMFKTATLTLNLAKQYSPEPHRDYAYWMDNKVRAADYTNISTATIRPFSKVQLLFDQDTTATTEAHWQFTEPIFLFTSAAVAPGQSRSTRIRVDAFAFVTADPISDIHIAFTLADAGPRPFSEWPECYEAKAKGMTREQRRARKFGRWFRETGTVEWREWTRFVHLLYSVLVQTWDVGGKAWWVSGDGDRKVEIRGSCLWGVMDELKKLKVEKGEELWLVAEAPGEPLKA